MSGHRRQVIESWLESINEFGPSDGQWLPSREYFAAVLKLALKGLDAPAPEGVTISLELLDFLSGIAALDGVWFGDKHPKYMGTFWWRRHLPDAPDNSPPMNSSRD